MKIGRPLTSESQKDMIVRKLELYLKSGLSLKKACFQAEVSRSTVYDLMRRDRDFSDKIQLFRQYISVMFSNIMVKQLFKIADNQRFGKSLTKEEWKFLKWFGTYSSLTKEEFGRDVRAETIDPEVEIMRIKELIDGAFDED